MLGTPVETSLVGQRILHWIAEEKHACRDQSSFDDWPAIGVILYGRWVLSTHTVEELVVWIVLLSHHTASLVY